MKTVIAVHTGTGNSLYIAKQFKNAEIHFIDEFLSGSYDLDDDTDRLGIVFPVYCWGLPYPVREFIREYLGQRDNSSLGYVFGIATCGAFPLYTLYDLSASLADVGIALSYSTSFKLPDAYLPLQKKAVSDEKAREAASLIKGDIERTVRDVENEETVLQGTRVWVEGKTLRMESGTRVHVDILDMQGRSLRKLEFAGMAEWEAPVGGLYVVRMESGKASVVHKVMVL